MRVCIDEFTRLAPVEALGDETGPTTVAFLRRAIAWFSEHGVRVQV